MRPMSNCLLVVTCLVACCSIYADDGNVAFKLESFSADVTSTPNAFSG